MLSISVQLLCPISHGYIVKQGSVMKQDNFKIYFKYTLECKHTLFSFIKYSSPASKGFVSQFI